jgi:23S rRNA pseudouridine1911/1915/1917 synthase
VIHADAALIVIDKAPGRVVHPAAGHAGDTLVNALLAHFPELATTFDGERPGIVHRLDRDTSGVIVVARTPVAAEALKAAFAARAVEKTYLALARGRVDPPAGLIDAAIGRDPRRRKRMAALPGGRPARTAYRLIAEAHGVSFLELRPETGRTHQIRVHLREIGHPVLGDPTYGRASRRIGRTALHAWRIAFDHPLTGQRVMYEAALPEDMRAALTSLGLPAEPPG